jgi:hypothetical protein
MSGVRLLQLEELGGSAVVLLTTSIGVRVGPAVGMHNPWGAVQKQEKELKQEKERQQERARHQQHQSAISSVVCSEVCAALTAAGHAAAAHCAQQHELDAAALLAALASEAATREVFGALSFGARNRLARFARATYAKPQEQRDDKQQQRDDKQQQRDDKQQQRDDKQQQHYSDDSDDDDDSDDRFELRVTVPASPSVLRLITRQGALFACAALLWASGSVKHTNWGGSGGSFGPEQVTSLSELLELRYAQLVYCRGPATSSRFGGNDESTFELVFRSNLCALHVPVSSYDSFNMPNARKFRRPVGPKFSMSDESAEDADEGPDDSIAGSTALFSRVETKGATGPGQKRSHIVKQYVEWGPGKLAWSKQLHPAFPRAQRLVARELLLIRRFVKWHPLSRFDTWLTEKIIRLVIGDFDPLPVPTASVEAKKLRDELLAKKREALLKRRAAKAQLMKDNGDERQMRPPFFVDEDANEQGPFVRGRQENEEFFGFGASQPRGTTRAATPPDE